MPHRPSIAPWAVIAALGLILALGACGSPEEPVDPLTLATPFTFEVDNPEEMEGPVYGAMIMPFESDPPIGMGIGPRMSPPPNLDALLNAIEDGELDAGGLVSGLLIPTYDVPRLNELVGLEFGWWVFIPPRGCDVTATNPVEAAIAPIFGIALWDGETVDEDGFPAVAGLVTLGEYSIEEDADTTTRTQETYLPAVSRAAWSATTGGVCEPEEDWVSSIDIDLQIAAGWQFLHVVETRVCDKATWNCSYSYTARSMTLAQVAAAGPIGTVAPMDVGPARATRSTTAPLAPIFR